MGDLSPDPYHPSGDFSLYIPGLASVLSERANRGVRAPNRGVPRPAAASNAEAYNRAVRDMEARAATAPTVPPPQRVKSGAQRQLDAAARQAKMDPYRRGLEEAKVAAQPKAEALAKAVAARTQELYAAAAAVAPP